MPTPSITRPGFLAAALAAALLCVPLHAAPTTQVVAVTGDPAPDGNGSFSNFFSFAGPALNDTGQVAFFATLTGTSGGSSDNAGIFRGDGVTAAAQIVRAGQAAPDANGSFSDFLGAPALNGAGQAAFFARLTGTNGGFTDNEGIFRGNGATDPVQIVRTGDAAPDNNGSFSAFDDPAFNDVGQAVFTAFLAGTSGGISDDEGIFRADGTTLSRIARAGQAAPDGNGSFSNFDFIHTPALNDAGQVAFRVDLTATSDDEGIFRGDGTTLTRIARAGQATPDADGIFSRFGAPALNDAGQVAFRADLTGTSDDDGIFRGDGTTLTQIVREGQAAPNGNGKFADFSVSVALNNHGQAAYIALLIDTSGGLSDNAGIFRGDGVTEATQVVRMSQAAPDGNGSFSAFGDPGFNDAGQAAFFATLASTSGSNSDDAGIFFYDDVLALLQVAREGDPFLGSTITGLGFSDSADINRNERSSFNELGQVAYRFELADGREGIAVWTVPEPTSAALLGLAATALLRRRR